MIEYADVIVDLQAGDTGKGKVAHALCKSGEFTHVIRYNGGGNAGHTVYHNGQKIVTHSVPVGVLYGIKSIIGPGCVVDPVKLSNEITDLKNAGVQVDGYLFIDKRVHLITPENIKEDGKDTTIGTTKTGNGPTYRNKYGRTGIRAEEIFAEEMLIDIYEELYGSEKVRILFEGAQGFELDIDWGDYPFVTSSHCTVGSAVLNGVPPHKIRKIYGIAKAYRTYVGNKSFETPSEIFDKIREVGAEYGATTGRKRQVDWFNMNDIIKAININGVTDLIINKIDVLSEVNVFKLFHNQELKNFEQENEIRDYIIDTIKIDCMSVDNVVFSTSPYDI